MSRSRLIRGGKPPEFIKENSETADRAAIRAKRRKDEKFS
jgi:hypothetical protein